MVLVLREGPLIVKPVSLQGVIRAYNADGTVCVVLDDGTELPSHGVNRLVAVPSHPLSAIMAFLDEHFDRFRASLSKHTADLRSGALPLDTFLTVLEEVRSRGCVVDVVCSRGHIVTGTLSCQTSEMVASILGDEPRDAAEAVYDCIESARGSTPVTDFLLEALKDRALRRQRLQPRPGRQSSASYVSHSSDPHSRRNTSKYVVMLLQSLTACPPWSISL